MKWKKVPGFDGDYEVSVQGQVRSHKGLFPRVLKQSVDSTGYKKVNLYRGDGPETYYVHRLVLLVFVGPKPAGMEACHNNGKKTDNRLSNLRYDTHYANIQDAVEHGSYDDVRALTPDQVRTIRKERAESDVKLRELAERFGVCIATIARVDRGETYRSVE
jgi:hypothetical protein